ncbi:MAG: hypothetical protein ACOX6P_06740 [Candidatus Merdivicinus sp.]|jgi:hypothetical protein
MKRYAFVDYGGQVKSIETRCSGLKKNEVQPGELAIEQIIHPDLIFHYVEITDETGEPQIGMLFSDGKFIENPVAPDQRLQNVEAAMISIMDTIVSMQGGSL